MARSNYEIVYIVDDQISDVGSVQAKIDALFPGDQIEHQSLGIKKFAYPIKKKLSGHYFLIKTNQEGEKIKEFSGEIRWIPEILRFLIINLAKEKHFRYSRASSRHLEKRQLWNKRQFDSGLIAKPDKVSSVDVENVISQKNSKKVTEKIKEEPKKD